MTIFAAMIDEQFYILTFFLTPFKAFKRCDDVFDCQMSEDGAGGDRPARLTIVPDLSSQIKNK